MIQKNTRIKIKPSGDIREYLHGLDGKIINTRERWIWKRTLKYN